MMHDCSWFVVAFLFVKSRFKLLALLKKTKYVDTFNWPFSNLFLSFTHRLMAVCLWLSVKFYEDINFTDAHYA